MSDSETETPSNVIYLHPTHPVMQKRIICPVCRAEIVAMTPVVAVDADNGTVLIIHERCAGAGGGL